MPKKPLKKKPIKKVLKQKQKQSQQQIVNVNIGKALREAVRRRSRPLAKSVMPPIQSTIFRVNEPAPSFFQPFSTQTAIKIPEPETTEKLVFTMPKKVESASPDKVEQPVDDFYNPPTHPQLYTRPQPYRKYTTESSMSDTGYDSDTPLNVRNFGGITGSARIIKKVDRIWTKTPDGKFILKEGVPVPEGKIFNTDTGRFYSPYKKKSIERKGLEGWTKSI